MEGPLNPGTLTFYCLFPLLYTLVILFVLRPSVTLMVVLHDEINLGFFSLFISEAALLCDFSVEILCLF